MRGCGGYYGAMASAAGSSTRSTARVRQASSASKPGQRSRHFWKRSRVSMNGGRTEQPPPASRRAKRLVKPKAERRAHRLERYNTVVDLHSRGIPIREIARRTGLNQNTVKRFVQVGQFPEPTFSAWLEHARHGDLKMVAEGLLADEAAVRAALTLPWSKGQVEGHTDRLKLLKRQMYGRASFDLLRRRFLYAG